jgi:hypothetical protein
MDQEFIINPISGARFHIIRPNDPASRQRIDQWAADITGRLRDRKSVTLTIDCQGYLLGECTKTGLCLQIGEIYEDNFDIIKSRPILCPPVGSR